MVTIDARRFYKQWFEAAMKEQVYAVGKDIRSRISYKVSRSIVKEAEVVYRQIIEDYYMDYDPVRYKRTYNLYDSETFIPPQIKQNKKAGLCGVYFDFWYTAEHMRPYSLPSKLTTFKEKNVNPKVILTSVMEGVRGINYEAWSPTEVTFWGQRKVRKLSSPKDIFTQFENYCEKNFDRFMVDELNNNRQKYNQYILDHLKKIKLY